MAIDMLVTYPHCGVGAHAFTQLRKDEGGNQRGLCTPFDLLSAALLQMDCRRWSELVYLLSVEADEDALNASVRFLGGYMQCVFADGLIDVAHVVEMLRVSGHALPEGYVAENDLRKVDGAHIVRRNWGDVMVLKASKAPVVLEKVFSRVSIQSDIPVLVEMFRPCICRTTDEAS